MLEDEKHIYFIMELIEHGNLLEVMEKISTNGWRFNDKDAANLIKQILMALNYLHK
jgi:serine/threonine protein kinase